MEIQIHDSLNAIDKTAWNKLNSDDSPFLLYEFLHALEATDCLGEQHGWYPRYVVIVDDSGEIIAACASYIKTNSYGEFVFDWAWAEAYEQNKLQYYPKLVVSIPYTPATGQRLLVREDQDYVTLSNMLVRAQLQYANDSKLSSAHYLFTDKRDTKTLESLGLRLRLGCQYHWQNHNYSSFDAFLSECTAKRRKTIRRERRSVSDQKLKLSVRSGDTLSSAEWRSVCELYTSTFDRKWGEASLNQAFFETAGKTMGERFVIVFCYENEQLIACSVMLRGGDTLYGRYWGCYGQYKDLHFEACYYQGIEYCIKHKLQYFEPGAQGEHKIPRGFVPTKTWSAHKIFHTGFDEAIGRYLSQETDAMHQQCDELHKLLPFKQKTST